MWCEMSWIPSKPQYLKPSKALYIGLCVNWIIKTMMHYRIIWSRSGNLVELKSPYFLTFAHYDIEIMCFTVIADTAGGSNISGNSGSANISVNLVLQSLVFLFVAIRNLWTIAHSIMDVTKPGPMQAGPCPESIWECTESFCSSRKCGSGKSGSAIRPSHVSNHSDLPGADRGGGGCPGVWPPLFCPRCRLLNIVPKAGSPLYWV